MTVSPIAVVTGAYRGLGLETCRQLAERGYLVVLTPAAR
jgi:NAD(P)-dependent dehydrogenase (short-subunit alcohol dehydrogenase family)